MTTKSLLSLLGLLFGAATLSAQSHSMTLYGDLDEGRSTGCYYCPNVPYTIRYSETPVRSTTVDLAYYKALSLPLRLDGTWDTTTTPPGLNVTSVQLISQMFQVSNTARTGSNLRFSANGAAGEVAITVVAFGQGFLPIFDSAMLIDPGTAFVLSMDLLDTQGSVRFDLPIPDAPELIGLRFWSQAAFFSNSALPYVSNPQRTLIDR